MMSAVIAAGTGLYFNSRASALSWELRRRSLQLSRGRIKQMRAKRASLTRPQLQRVLGSRRGRILRAHFGGDLCLEPILELCSLLGDLVTHDPQRRTEVQAFANSEHRNVHA